MPGTLRARPERTARVSSSRYAGPGYRDRGTSRPSYGAQAYGSSYGSTALLERPRTGRGEVASPRTLPRENQQTRGYAQPPAQIRPNTRRYFQHKPGSNQVFSVRGRRVESPKADRRMVRVVLLSFFFIIAGIFLSTYLSGLSTQATFHIQQLQQDQATVSHEIESINRDVEAARAAGEFAAEAMHDKFVVPTEPGLLEVTNTGAVEERLPSHPGTSQPIVNVNDGANRPARPDSDPRRTAEVRGNLQRVPEHRGALTPGSAAPDAEQAPPGASPGNSADLPYSGR